MSDDPRVWSAFEHILHGLKRPTLGDPREPSLWPSEASASSTSADGRVTNYGKCKREMFFRYLIQRWKWDPEWFHEEAFPEKHVNHLLAIQKPADDYMRFIWAAGELYEKYIVDQTREFGIYLHSQVPMYIKDYNLSGKMDLIILNPITEKLVITEIKSVYGHNADMVLGTASSRKKGVLGTPRDSNLMQIAIYHWWFADSTFEYSRLLYGARDTGRFAEYQVRVLEDNNTIQYRPIYPIVGDWTTSPITINSILQSYSIVQNSAWKNVLPPRDYKLKYDFDDILYLYNQDELGKTDTVQFEKILERRKENEELIASGKSPKVELKLPDKGDYQCKFCQFQDMCYKNGEPRNIEWTPSSLSFVEP